MMQGVPGMSQWYNLKTYSIHLSVKKMTDKGKERFLICLIVKYCIQRFKPIFAALVNRGLCSHHINCSIKVCTTLTVYHYSISIHIGHPKRSLKFECSFGMPCMYGIDILPFFKIRNNKTLLR